MGILEILLLLQFLNFDLSVFIFMYMVFCLCVFSVLFFIIIRSASGGQKRIPWAGITDGYQLPRGY